jgi:cell wall-associated NlpC family hydrolase
MEKIRHLIGIPYSEKDCWSLCKSFYSEVLGIELKNYFETLPQDRVVMKNLVYTNMGDFQKTDSPKFGDIILIKFKGLESHIAIFIDNSTMFHTTTSTGSVIDRIARWKPSIVGFYTVRNNL